MVNIPWCLYRLQEQIPGPSALGQLQHHGFLLAGSAGLQEIPHHRPGTPGVSPSAPGSAHQGKEFLKFSFKASTSQSCSFRGGRGSFSERLRLLLGDISFFSEYIGAIKQQWGIDGRGATSVIASSRGTLRDVREILGLLLCIWLI